MITEYCFWEILIVQLHGFGWVKYCMMNDIDSINQICPCHKFVLYGTCIRTDNRRSGTIDGDFNLAVSSVAKLKSLPIKMVLWKYL